MIRFRHNPTISTRVTSHFGTRTNPITKVRDFHHGTDFGALRQGVQGDPLFAVADGTVVVSKVDGKGITRGYGNYIVVQHDGFATLYAHIRSLDVKVGQTVKAGQVIGSMGNTGASTNPHLHFELIEGLYRDRKRIDPINYIISKSESQALNDNIQVLKETVGLQDITIKYLLDYEYGEELIRKIAVAVRGG